MISRTERQRRDDYETIWLTLTSFGCRHFKNGLKEPELVTATGLDERRVMLAVRWACKSGYLWINDIGEVTHR